MSNAVCLTLTIASFFAGFAGYIYTWKWIHQLANEIATGTSAANAIPLPKRHRSLLLNARWANVVMSVFGCTAFTAAVNITLANLASDPGVVLIAYLAAGISVLVTIGGPIHGTLESCIFGPFCVKPKHAQRLARDTVP